jgi:lipid A disaccharide synthetase
VKELFAHLFTTDNLIDEMTRILRDDQYRNEMIASYKVLRDKLGEPGTARRAATCIYQHKKV